MILDSKMYVVEWSAFSPYKLSRAGVFLALKKFQRRLFDKHVLTQMDSNMVIWTGQERPGPGVLHRMNSGPQAMPIRALHRKNSGPIVVLFTTQLNSKVEAFCSCPPDPLALPGNALRVDWSKGLLYMYPPLPLLSLALYKMMMEDAQVVVILLW